jgi:hypothetical protein
VPKNIENERALVALKPRERLPGDEGGDQDRTGDQRGQHRGAGPAQRLAADDPEGEAEEATADQGEPGQV